MPEFNLTLFGGFIFSKADGEEIYIANAKERALLAYLALHPGKPLARSHLAGLLWGEQSERRARHSLSQALSSLCGGMGDAGAVINRGKQRVSLQPDAFAVDVAAF
jgi:DNA-binding SARP family transcriptional activator